ncbi:CGNR zinc finger domain-containing protein [Nonomuraea rhodomycinica]|uniref:CGNR zinc finger domain-containing protein n=1 Tax=Nonomuraea rhodomycinica TaxID=1712872 RepID=UPI0028A9A11B|nr:CGNR zinc finger domain-containing protein [Nonomuraea rhodomycinica]
MALDLVNTVWREHGALMDQFDDLDGLRAWLSDHDMDGADAGADGLDTDGLGGDGLGGDAGAGLEAVRDRLVRAREAVRDTLEGRGSAGLNDVLAHGSVRPMMRDGEPYELVVVDEPAWRPAWTAAAAFVRMMAERPSRVRPCAHPECVLWFLDVSKNGSRRWCSMESCGNRAKAGRFSRRHKTTG